MSRALWLLVFLAVRARYRRILHGLGTPKGLLLMLLGAGLFAFLVLLPHLAESGREAGMPELGAATTPPLQRFGPAGLLFFTLLSLFSSARNRGIYFSPAESDFLFPAPFTRRELLAYRLFTMVVHTVLSVLFTSAFLYRYLQGFCQTAAGLFLAFTFLNLIQVAGSLVAGSLEERLVARGRRFVGLVLLLAAGLVFAGSTAAIRGGEELFHGLRELLGSRALGWALLPLKTFSEALAAPDAGSFLLWGGAALAVDAALFALVLRLDIDFTEASLESSRRIHERLEKARRGGRFVLSHRKLRLPLPFPGRLGGAGPLAWRQAQEMVRETPGTVYLLIVVLLGAFLPYLFIPRDLDLQARASSGTLTWLVAMAPFILSSWFRFDFRGDLERVELLFTLPVRPALVALGQLLVPALVLSGVQALGLAVLWVLGGADTPEGGFLLGYGPLFCLPFNLLFVAIENLVFLLYPVRAGPVAPGDFQTLGRVMLNLLLKVLALVAVLGPGVLLGYQAWSMTGGSRLAVAAVALGFLLLADVAAVLLVGAAFARFEVARAPAE